MLVAQPRRPPGVDGTAFRQRAGQRRERKAWMRKKLDNAPPVLAQLLGIVRDAKPARTRENRWRAVPRLVVELATNRNYQVGFLHRAGTNRAHERRVRAGHETATLLRVQVKRAGAIEKAHELRGAVQRPTPRDH